MHHYHYHHNHHIKIVDQADNDQTIPNNLYGFKHKLPVLKNLGYL